MTRVIVNADDFGYDADSTRATIESFEAGALTSASIMPNMPGTAEAVSYAVVHPEHSYGVHLTFVGEGPERPISDPAEVPALVAPEGHFLPSQQVRLRAMRGRVPVDQIEHEMTRQIARLRDMGLSISHVDSHCHLHKFGPFLHALERVLPRFGIRRVRTAQDTYITKHYGSPTYWYGRVWQRRIRQRFQTTEHFFMATDVADAESIDALLPLVRGSTMEVGGHPGSTGWRRAEGIALRRFASTATEAGHLLIRWSDI